jgi:uncharacterized DUF497 family protein
MATRIDRCNYNILWDVTFDPAKRAQTLLDRGLDFADAPIVFSGVTFGTRKVNEREKERLAPILEI